MAQKDSQTGPASTATAPTAPQTSTGSAGSDAARVAELERENKALREQLAAAGEKAETARPHTPSFVFSASMLDELETTGRTVSPFDGKRYVGTGRDDAKEATVEEFNNAKPPARDAEESTDRKPAVGRKR